jgi:hypothetical protein
LAFSFFFFLIHEWVDEQRSTAERENKKFTQKENLLLAPHQIELAQPRVLLFRSLSWKSPRGEGMFTHSIGDNDRRCNHNSRARPRWNCFVQLHTVSTLERL